MYDYRKLSGRIVEILGINLQKLWDGQREPYH